jgi:hypothetical protein
MFRERARTEHRSELASVGAELLALVIRRSGASPASGHGRPRAVPSLFLYFGSLRFEFPKLAFRKENAVLRERQVLRQHLPLTKIPADDLITL